MDLNRFLQNLFKKYFQLKDETVSINLIFFLQQIQNKDNCSLFFEQDIIGSIQNKQINIDLALKKVSFFIDEIESFFNYVRISEDRLKEVSEKDLEKFLEIKAALDGYENDLTLYLEEINLALQNNNFEEASIIFQNLKNNQQKFLPYFNFLINEKI